MPRFSCVIPVVGATNRSRSAQRGRSPAEACGIRAAEPPNAFADLEATLVSVLENRPDDCEIVVVVDRPYPDPYDLRGEVRFIEAAGQGMAACATCGIRGSHAPIVNLLAAGVEVAEGWADAAMPHFDDPDVAAVAPLIRDWASPARLLAAGVEYHRGGRHVVHTERPASGSADSLGPTIDAAFYRKTALEACGGGLPDDLGDRLAAVDLAVRLGEAGWRLVVEPDCVVSARQLVGDRADGFRAGLYAERLFLRHLTAHGWLAALAAHPLSVARELGRSLPHGTTLAQIAGRLSAWTSFAEFRRNRRRPDGIADEIAGADRAANYRQAAVAGAPDRSTTRRLTMPLLGGCLKRPSWPAR